MAIQNLISINFTEEELTRLDGALDVIEDVMRGKLIQLSPKESQRYGKLGNETENWVNMVATDCSEAPQLVPAFVNNAEWARDEKSRQDITPRLTCIESIANNLGDTNRLIGFDIYNTSLTVYNNVKYLDSQNVPGTAAYYEKWRIQFPGAAGNNPNDNEETPPPPIQ